MSEMPPVEPPQASCREALERIYEYLDGELTPELDERIRAHLAACRRCFPTFEHERVFLRFIQQRAQIEQAPPSLRKRIFRALLHEGGAIEPEE